MEEMQYNKQNQFIFYTEYKAENLFYFFIFFSAKLHIG